MSQIEERLNKLKIILPEPKSPVGAYVATKIVGKLLFISGQISTDSDNNLITGKIGKELNSSLIIGNNFPLGRAKRITLSPRSTRTLIAFLKKLTSAGCTKSNKTFIIYKPKAFLKLKIFITI